MGLVKFIFVKICNVIAIAWVSLFICINIKDFAIEIVISDWTGIAAYLIVYAGAIMTLCFLLKTLTERRKSKSKEVK